MAERGYRDLAVWQKAIDLVVQCYRVTEAFPKSELYGLTSQMRRAAVSVPSNIAEGQARRSLGTFHQFLCIATGSLAEIETQLVIAVRLGFLTVDAAQPVIENAAEIGRMLHGLRRSMQAEEPKGVREATDNFYEVADSWDHLEPTTDD